MKQAVAAVFAFALLLPGAVRADEKKVTHAFKTSIPADGIRRMIVELPVAEVSVRNSTKNEVVIEGVAQKKYSSEKDRDKQQAIVDAASLDLRIRGHRMMVVRKFGAAAQGRRVQRNIDYKVTVSIPQGMELEVTQDVGELDVAGSFGDMDLELDVGEMRVKTPKRNIRELNAKSTIGEVKTNLGDRIIEKEGLFAGRTQFFNEGGKALLMIDVNVGEVAIELTQ